MRDNIEFILETKKNGDKDSKSSLPLPHMHTKTLDSNLWFLFLGLQIVCSIIITIYCRWHSVVHDN